MTWNWPSYIAGALTVVAAGVGLVLWWYFDIIGTYSERRRK